MGYIALFDLEIAEHRFFVVFAQKIRNIEKVVSLFASSLPIKLVRRFFLEMR